MVSENPIKGELKMATIIDGKSLAKKTRENLKI